MSSPTKQTSIDDLPPEMVCELFKHLRPKSLAACSMVNKRWHSIFTSFRLDRLVVEDFALKFGKWSYPDRRIEDQELCRLKMFCQLADQPLVSKLSHLALFNEEARFDLNKLNRFRQLVHLEINGSEIKKKVNLNLPKLKVLAIYRQIWEYNTPLSIDCPELSVLVYQRVSEDMNLLEVKHPETIRKLETDMSGPKLTRFKSVECLVTQEFQVISKATLLSLPRLKEFHYNLSISEAFWNAGGEVGTFDRMKRVLREFMDDVTLLRKPDFKFTFAGFQLTKTMLDEIDFDVQVKKGRHEEYETASDSYVYMKNYQLVNTGALNFIYTVRYTDLMNNVAGAIPDCFSKKFTRVVCLHVAGAIVQDQTNFLRFLRSLGWLRSLGLSGTQFSQAFYNQLPASAHSLTKITCDQSMFRDNEKEVLELNFDFIDKLPRLSKFFIYKFSSFESLASLVRWLGKLESAVFYFRLKENEFCVSNGRDSKLWEMSSKTEFSLKTKNPDEILNYFQSLKSDSPKKDQASG